MILFIHSFQVLNTLSCMVLTAVNADVGGHFNLVIGLLVFRNQSKKQSNVFALRCFCVASFWQRNAQTLRCSLDCCTICH